MKTTDVKPGDRFEKLVVVSNAPNKRNYRCWLCRCDCGVEKAVSAFNLVNGQAKSCGCARHGCKVIHAGDQHWRLTAIRFEVRKGAGGFPYWWFSCSCGKEVLLNAYRVIRGGSKSCGCLRREKASSRKGIPRPSSDGGKRSLFSRYKCRAHDRQIEFSLSYDQFCALVSTPCSYCGKMRPISPNSQNRNILLSGIDRVDSDVGYTVENCVPSCTPCNMAKNSMSTAAFKQWVSDVYSHLNKV